MEIANKNEQQIAINHSSGIDFKDFIKIYQKFIEEKYSFLANDTALKKIFQNKCIIKSWRLMIRLRMKN